MSDAILNVDVAVVGAGPTGATAAIAFARRGARVALVDGHPEAARRFAGEWIHPPGVETLARLGVDTERLAAQRGWGFAIFGDDGRDPVCLPYQKGCALTRVHAELVQELREHALSFANVSYLPHHALTGISDGVLELNDRKRSRRVLLRAERILGADGRSSRVRAALEADTGSELLSYMAGLELRDVELPFEGMGHVLLGGPGPALVYRISSRVVRACLDLPLEFDPVARRPGALFEAFAPHLPRQLRAAFRDAVQRPCAWAATRFRPRAMYGRDKIWLMGDAAGHVHPLSGVGITLGVMDADAAAQSDTLAEYRRRREASVVELLGSVLYLAFSRHDASAVRVRHGLLQMLRENPRERARTMRLLTGEDRAGSSFASSFLRATGHVLVGGLERTAFGRQSLPELTHQLRQDAAWLRWPLTACVPASARTPALTASWPAQALSIPRSLSRRALPPKRAAL